MAELPCGATVKEFNAKEAYSHLKGTTNCSVCREPLGEVAYDLHVPGQEREGVQYGGYGAQFCSEEHALQWVETDYLQRQYSTPITPDGLPTQETQIATGKPSKKPLNRGDLEARPKYRQPPVSVYSRESPM
jgi:hypothetical protein